MSKKIGILMILFGGMVLVGQLLAVPPVPGEPRITDGLLVYYSFDDPCANDDSLVIDGSGKGRHGKMYGMSGTGQGTELVSSPAVRGGGSVIIPNSASFSPTPPSKTNECYVDLQTSTWATTADLPTKEFTYCGWVRCDPCQTTDESTPGKHEHCMLNIASQNAGGTVFELDKRLGYFFQFSSNDAELNRTGPPWGDFEVWCNPDEGIYLRKYYFVAYVIDQEEILDEDRCRFYERPAGGTLSELGLSRNENPGWPAVNLCNDWTEANIGQQYVDRGNRLFIGHMDEFYLFNRALEPWELEILASDSEQEKVGTASATGDETLVIEPTDDPCYDTIEVVLDSAPSSDVYVTAQESSADIQFVGSPTLTFTSANWSTPQTITVAATDDGNVEDPVEEATVTFNITGDAAFAGQIIPPITVQVVDNDRPVVMISPATVNVTEGGATDSYNVWLLYDPGTGVTVTVDPCDLSAPDEVTFAPPLLNFTGGAAGNYKTPQLVTVTAVDDSEPEPPNAGSFTTITHSVTGGSYNRSALTRDVIAVIDDNDCGAWGYAPGDFNEDCEVNILDFAVLSANYLQCTNPYAAGCVRAD